VSPLVVACQGIFNNGDFQLLAHGRWPLVNTPQLKCQLNYSDICSQPPWQNTTLIWLCRPIYLPYKPFERTEQKTAFPTATPLLRA
jgi:hypothetical protein